MEKDMVWAKTILSVYRYLERICGAIDKIVMQSALGSGEVTGGAYSHNNVYSISQKIIDYSQRKVTLINLKVLVEDILKNIPISDAKILIERYVNGAKRREISERLEISMRTVYRKIERAEKSFLSKMCQKGYSSFKLQQFLKDEVWIKSAYDMIESEGDENFVISKINLKKAASM